MIRELVHNFDKTNHVIMPGMEKYPGIIEITGKNNSIICAGQILGTSPHIRIGQSGGAYTRAPENCVIFIGEGVSFGRNVSLFVAEHSTLIYIGKHSMFSWNIEMWATDSHSVIDLEGNLLNRGKYISIDKHCWIGRSALVNKNSIVSKNSIVGNGAIVAKRFFEGNVAIGGNPAKILKSGINWDEQPVNVYEENRQPIVRRHKSFLNKEELIYLFEKLNVIASYHKDKNIDHIVNLIRDEYSYA